MKLFTFAIITLISISSFAQIEFENGYIIDNNNRKINCLIKNIDWKYSPDQIIYKLTDNGSVTRVDVDNIKEFGISSTIKYRKFQVEIDQSSNRISDLNFIKNPIYKSEVVLLRQLVQGNANLYVLEKPSRHLFFYSKNDSNPTQLIHKRYKISSGKIAYNDHYKQQLFNNLTCNSKNLNNLSYSKKALKELFIEHNNCIGMESVVYDDVQNNKTSYHLRLKAGINMSSMSISDGFNAAGKEMNNVQNIRFGFETEIILPFNRNKWAVYVGPSFNSYKDEISYGSGTSATNLKVKFNYAEIDLGIKHYMFLNTNSKLFINTAFSFGLPANTDIVYDMDRQIDPFLNNFHMSPTLSLGIGYNYKNLSFELLSKPSRKITGHNGINNNFEIYWKSDMQNLSFIVGYRIL